MRTHPLGTSGASASLSVGLAVGEGTGPELALVFEAALDAWARAAGVAVELARCERVFRTFGGVLAAGLTAVEVAASSGEDAAAYEAFVRELAARGGRVIFRTAFNAQPLYVVRERLQCAKVEALPGAYGDIGEKALGGGGPARGSEILLVRDQAQGFYGGLNDDPATSPDAIHRTTVFTREVTWRLLDFALGEAHARWGCAPDHVVMAYKFHLLDARLATWVADYGRVRGGDVKVFQPDTMNRNLMRGVWRGRVLVVGGNEWGDIMHADLLHRAGLGAQDERCSKNVYLADGVAGMVEYQTVHGSADDIAGRDLVNPSATLRAAAAILEDHGGVAGVRAAVDRALARAARDGMATPDVGGRAGSRAVAERIIADVAATLRAGDASGAGETSGAARAEDALAATPSGSAEALVVIDMQRDFCAADGRFAALGLIDASTLAALGERLAELVAGARRAGVPVVVVRTETDPELPPNVRARHEREGRGGYLAAGSRGAEAFAVAPQAGDKHVVKRGYDAFLGTDLEAWLGARGIGRVVLAGVFAEVCLDAAARTAFQKGLEVDVVSDGTAALERELGDVLGFMQRFYGARALTASELLARWSAAEAR
ncbi:MAG: isochorismatase family protein [Myxococcota bacterium]